MKKLLLLTIVGGTLAHAAQVLNPAGVPQPAAPRMSREAYRAKILNAGAITLEQFEVDFKNYQRDILSQDIKDGTIQIASVIEQNTVSKNKDFSKVRKDFLSQLTNLKGSTFEAKDLDKVLENAMTKFSAGKKKTTSQIINIIRLELRDVLKGNEKKLTMNLSKKLNAFIKKNRNQLVFDLFLGKISQFNFDKATTDTLGKLLAAAKDAKGKNFKKAQETLAHFIKETLTKTLEKSEKDVKNLETTIKDLQGKIVKEEQALNLQKTQAQAIDESKLKEMQTNLTQLDDILQQNKSYIDFTKKIKDNITTAFFSRAVISKLTGFGSVDEAKEKALTQKNETLKTLDGKFKEQEKLQKEHGTLDEIIDGTILGDIVQEITDEYRLLTVNEFLFGIGPNDHNNAAQVTAFINMDLEACLKGNATLQEKEFAFWYMLNAICWFRNNLDAMDGVKVKALELFNTHKNLTPNTTRMHTNFNDRINKILKGDATPEGIRFAKSHRLNIKANLDAINNEINVLLTQYTSAQ